MVLLKPGFDLDALVADEIFGEPLPTDIDENGLNAYLSGSPTKSEGGWWMLLYDYENGDNPEWTPLPFSQEIRAAWQVVERLADYFTDYKVQLDGHGGRWTFHVFKDGNCYESMADTAPLAIYPAAPKATEAKAI